MDRSRFGGGEVRFVDDAAAAAPASLVIVDLDRCDDLEGFASLGASTIGFGSHVDAAGLARASTAGIDEVMTRSAFFRRLPELLAFGGRRPSAPIDPDGR